ncbi:MAG: hypothetical protein HRT95_02080 [Moritella sp.]|nr:hypothetical protein [Moritella sp.]
MTAYDDIRTPIFGVFYYLAVNGALPFTIHVDDCRRIATEEVPAWPADGVAKHRYRFANNKRDTGIALGVLSVIHHKMK